MPDLDGLAIGIDVSADTAWVVAIDPDTDTPAVVKTLLCHPLDRAALVAFCVGATSVAIDSPGGISRLAHLGDERLSPKFQRARCSEVALSKTGIRVPWVTPAEEASLPAWMATGVRIWADLKEAGHHPLETYPHGALWHIAGRPLLHKQRPAGALERLRALSKVMTLPDHAEMWSHDAIDATAAALVARHYARGTAVCASCSDDEIWPNHDGSTIWLPPDARPGPSPTRSTEGSAQPSRIPDLADPTVATEGRSVT